MAANTTDTLMSQSSLCTNTPGDLKPNSRKAIKVEMGVEHMRRPELEKKVPGISSAAASMLSGSLTVEKYILLLRQKDDRIRALEEENRKLRSALIAKTGEHELQCRVDELVTELERHSDLVGRLQTELAMARGAGTPKETSCAGGRKGRKLPAGSHQLTNRSHNANTPSQQSQRSVHRAPTNTDEICAELQSFVERNKQQNNGAQINGQGRGGQQQQAESQQIAEEDLTAQLAKMMADDPSLLHALLFGGAPAAGTDLGMLASDEESKLVDPNLLALLFDPTAATAAGAETPNGLMLVAQSAKQEQQPEEQQQASEQQQNVDFEEVMQRVIGEAMKSGRGQPKGAAKARPPVAIPTPPTNFNGTTPAATAPEGGAKGSKPRGAPTAAITPAPSLSKKNVQQSSKKSAGAGPVAQQKKGTAAPSLVVSTSNSSAPHHHHSSTVKPFTAEEQRLVRELEARIDENIIALGPRPLNTAELATQCTRVMRAYSIGQRLFARTVMVQVSQSQGSLSELLSKPRPWHKLTDKGREAFRRIFGWISDDTAIELLCQLSPRKVALTERLDHPQPENLLEPLDGPNAAVLELMAAGGGAGPKRSMRHLPCSGSEQSTRSSISSPKSTEMAAGGGEQPSRLGSIGPAGQGPSREAGGGIAAGGGGRWRHDDIPKEKILDIYEAEKAKLMEQETQVVGRAMNGSTCGSRMDSASPPHAANATATANVLSLGVIKKVRPSMGLPSAAGPANDDQPAAGRSSSVCSSTIGSDGGLSALAAAEGELLLQQMSQQQKTNGNGGSRLELFPVSQSQLEQFTCLDTEEIARQVKDFLAKNAVSQRQFGESVLGLSQGSVSDLLARPKSWQSLTHKGREPFIRMHIFMDQYKTQCAGKTAEGEEELQMDGPTDMDGGLEPDQQTELELKLELPPDSVGEQQQDNSDGEREEGEEEEREEGEEEEQMGEEEEGKEEREEERSEMDEPQQKAASAMGDGEGADSGHLLESILANIKTGREVGHGREKEEPKPSPCLRPGKSDAAKSTCSSAALSQANRQPSSPTDEVDTADVARRVKDRLSGSGISQRAFGEHILKVTSGCVSDLLSKPKPWVMLTWKNRECYTKMVDFLADPRAVDKLRADEQQRCEMNNALNAIKAIVAANPPCPMANGGVGEEKKSAEEEKLGLAGLSAFVEQQNQLHLAAHNDRAIPSSGSDHSSSSSALQIVADLAGELGASTPNAIGTALAAKRPFVPKKAHSPIPPPARIQTITKRKTAAPEMVAISTTPSLVPLESHSNLGGLLGPPAKKIPRFQRTIISETQKEALLFIFAHEQRPSRRCIDQLAEKIGLPERTITNWFHNYRTRQKAKEVKQEGDFCPPSTPVVASQPLLASTPTPAQVLARALNATDTKTANWFQDLAELLRRHSDANIDLNCIGGGGGSVGTSSAASSPPSPQNAALGLGDEEEPEGRLQIADDESQEANEDSGEERDRAHSCGASSNTSTSAPSPFQAHSAGSSQLDKVIARMHSRLLAGGTSKAQ